MNKPDKEKKYAKRSFTIKQKQKCWSKARMVEGRHPDRWRYDPLGNLVCNALRGCLGPLCHEYDHIYPYSRGGKTSSKNCQILQTRVNRYKSNLIMTEEELSSANFNMKFSEDDLDTIEKAVYGDIQKVFEF
ncbi:unnamed protein product [Blepharisma stoltei]|uniref:HNH nuclease domain-containing protein n=1 Tax=Blepharisma stoltei TaxID=1481888 RepID=A0AAU9J754_9CILI|nr:unnamed protein product [Blepharisma stoltei]